MAVKRMRCRSGGGRRNKTKLWGKKAKKKGKRKEREGKRRGEEEEGGREGAGGATREGS